MLLTLNWYSSESIQFVIYGTEKLEHCLSVKQTTVVMTIKDHLHIFSQTSAFCHLKAILVAFNLIFHDWLDF